jgi:hypothetical protein
MRVYNNHRPRDRNRPIWEKIRYQIGKVRDFRRELRNCPPDLVHIKTSSGVNFHQNAVYAHVALRSGLPVLLQIHDGKFEAFYWESASPIRAWIRQTLRSVSRVLVLSQYWMERTGTLAPGAKLGVIPNGLGEDEILALTPPRRTRHQVLFLGTCEAETTREKGLDD